MRLHDKQLYDIIENHAKRRNKSDIERLQNIVFILFFIFDLNL